MNTLKPRIASLLHQLNERVFEKEHIVALALLSAVAGESIFLLGPPGVAKSMVGRRLKLAFRNASAFEYLMSRFSTPDEIFGPVSISKLKDEDTYERMVDGYLPSATIAFLDEIWKAGPAIQNALLTIINEKIYRNGQFSIRVPLKGLIAASNELPAQGQGLEALWDRFLLRCLVGGIEDMGEFDRMISSTDETEPVVDESLQITDEEYIRWEKEMAAIKIHYSIFEVIHALKDQIEQYNLQIQNEGGVSSPLYVSDRRWKKMVKLLKASAFLNGMTIFEAAEKLIELFFNGSHLIRQSRILLGSIHQHFPQAIDSSHQPGNRFDYKAKNLEACFLVIQLHMARALDIQADLAIIKHFLTDIGHSIFLVLSFLLIR